MNLEEAKKIIQKEHLSNYVMFSDGLNQAEKVILEKEKDKWKVYTNDERATAISTILYSSLEEALDDFIERLRGDKGFRDYLEGKDLD